MIPFFMCVLLLVYVKAFVSPRYTFENTEDDLLEEVIVVDDVSDVRKNRSCIVT